MAIREKKQGSVLLIKGIDTSVPAEYIDNSSSRNSENFEVSRGVITKRDGTVQLGAIIGGTKSYIEVMGGRFFSREGVDYNIRIGKEYIERYEPTTDHWIDISGAYLTGESDDIIDTAIPLLSGNPILCITNGIDNIRKWTATGNTADLGGSPPKAKFIQEYKTYLICANIVGGTDVFLRVQWCDTADPEDWSTGNAGSVDLVEDGDEITGLNLFGDYICVHKENSIYLGYPVSSTNIFQFVRKATGVGAIANRSIQNMPNGEQIFLAKDGLYLFNGVNCRTLSPAINEEIRDSLNTEYIHKTWSVLVREKREVWIGIPVGSNNYGEVVYKYNYETGIILKDTRTKANAGWLGRSSSGLSWDDMSGSWDSQTGRWDGTGLIEDSDSIIISDYDGYTYAVSNSTRDDDGVAVSAKWVTKDYQDSQQRIARFNKLELWAKGSSVKVEYSTDQGETWVEMVDSPMTLSDTYPSMDAPDIFYFDVVSSTIRFRFSNSTSEESLAIKQFIISYIPREERK